MAKRISIINFKGGVGKTTLSFHLACGLVRFYPGTKVLLIDMDHQSSLSIVVLGADGWEYAVSKQHTVDTLFQNFVGSSSYFPDKKIIIKNSMRRCNEKYRDLDLVPASLDLDNTEIELTASHQGNAIQSEWNKRTLICKWIEETGIDEEYDYIIFDCPPATKIVSQNAFAASHGYVLPVVPEAVMERGAPHLHEMVKTGIDKRLQALAVMGEKRPIFVPNTELVGLAVTRIQTFRGYSGYTNDHYQHLQSLQRRWREKLLEPYIVQGTGISDTLSQGVPAYEKANTQNIGGRNIHQQYEKLTDSIKSRIDVL